MKGVHETTRNDERGVIGMDEPFRCIHQMPPLIALELKR